MRYDSQVGNPTYNPGGTSADMGSLTNPDAINPTLSMDNRTQNNMGVKPSGAPVPFNPRTQQTITDMFGMSMPRTYARRMGVSTNTTGIDTTTY